MKRATPNCDVEVRYYIGRGWFLWHGHIEYRKLPGRGQIFGTFWLEYRKRGMFDAPYPLCRARKRGKLEIRLREEAESLGHIVKAEAVVSP